MHVDDIPKAQIAILAQMLYHPPSESQSDYVSRVFCLEQQLDRPYLRPDFLHRLIQKPQSYYTRLCEVHKILNAKVVHAIFLLLANEVGLRLNSVVVAGRDKVGPQTWDVSILNLRSLHGAWLHPEVFWDTFGHTLETPSRDYTDEDYMTKWIKEDEVCEACIMSRIGGDLYTVLDLQMALKSRTRTKSVRKFKQPRLTRVVEAWLDAWKLSYNPDRWRYLLEWNQLRVDRLKAVRKDLARERKRARSGRKGEGGESRRRRRTEVTKPAIQHERQRTDEALAAMKPKRPIPPRSHDSEETLKDSSLPDSSKQEPELTSWYTSEDDDDEPDIKGTLHDAENEIIDCYAALISTPFLPGMDTAEHKRLSHKLSLYQDRMVTQDNSPWPMIEDETGNANDQQLSRSQSARHRRPTNYSESVYSQVSNSFQAATNFPPTSKRDSVSTIKRSTSVQDKRGDRRGSDKSWVTMSVQPSEGGSQLSLAHSHSHNRNKPRKPERKFDTIAEESGGSRPSSRSSSQRRYSVENPLVSPVTIRTLDQLDGFSFSQSRDGRDSPPISPISKISQISQISPTAPNPQPRHSTPRPTRSDSRIKNRESTSTLRPQVKPRLSRPFSGPSAQNTSLLSSVRRLREPSSPPLPSSSGSRHTRDRGRSRGDSVRRNEDRDRDRERARDSNRHRDSKRKTVTDKHRDRDREHTQNRDSQRHHDSSRDSHSHSESEGDPDRDWNRRSTTWSQLYGNQRERLTKLEEEMRGVRLDGNGDGKDEGRGRSGSGKGKGKGKERDRDREEKGKR